MRECGTGRHEVVRRVAGDLSSCGAYGTAEIASAKAPATRSATA